MSHVLCFLYWKSKIVLVGESEALGWEAIKQSPLFKSFFIFQYFMNDWEQNHYKKCNEDKVRWGLPHHSSCQQSLNRVTLIRSYSAVISAVCKGSCMACSITECDGHIISLCGATPLSIKIIILIDINPYMTGSLFSKMWFHFLVLFTLCITFLYETGPIRWMFSQHCGYWWPGALAMEM